MLVAAGFATVAAAAVFYAAVWRGGAANAVSSIPELLSVLPPGAPTLIYIDLAAMRESSFYQHRPDRSPIAVPDRDYAAFVQATGFDFEKDLDRVVIASWPQSSVQDQKKTIVVADGRFDHQKIQDYALRNGKIDLQQGHEVFLFPTSVPNAWNSLLFLNDHRVALVAGSSITSVLTPHAVDSANDPARKFAEHLAGAAVFAITRAPEVPDNFALGGIQSSQLASLTRSVQWITLAARPEGENVRVSLEGECRTTADARQLLSVLEMLRMFARAGLESPKTRQTMDPATFRVLDTLLKTADLNQTAERVRILVEITPGILKRGESPNAH